MRNAPQLPIANSPTAEDYWGDSLGYFDSGDLALSAADKVTDNGEIKTGAAYPMRDSISRPYAPVPINSNVENDANRDFSGMKCPIPEMADSPLHQQNQKGDKKMRE
ncbi:hypothetical protein AtubIFM55763_011617 [Aspergillus tubingensis]|nr:hypothetical protein AtubIFM55763_011617 [Aspergillus tubingensis]